MESFWGSLLLEMAATIVINRVMEVREDKQRVLDELWALKAKYPTMEVICHEVEFDSDGVECRRETRRFIEVFIHSGWAYDRNRKVYVQAIINP